MTLLLHPHAPRYLPFNYERWGCLEPYQLYGDQSWQDRVKRFCGRLCEEIGDLPIRLEFKRASEWDLREAERTRGLERWTLEDGDRVLGLIRDDAKFAKLTTAEAEALVDHPDERVVEAMVRLRLDWLTLRPTLVDRLGRRALEGALREGVVWTPLLDRLAIADLWPEPLPEPTYEADPEGYFDRPHGLHAGKEGWLRVLAAWIHTASPEQAHLMLRFESDEARLATVLGAKNLSAASVQLVLRALPFAHLMARNSRLGQEGAGLLLDWVMSVASSSDPSTTAVVEFALSYLAKRGQQVPTQIADRLETLLRSGEPACRGKAPTFAAWILARQREVTPERLRWIVGRFPNENELMVAIAHHERGDLQVWRALAASCSLPRVRKRLSELPAARQDEEVRRVLLSSKALEVLTNLVRGATPEEFVELVERIAEKNPTAAADVLGESPEHLARVRDQLERKAAIGHIARLDAVTTRVTQRAGAPAGAEVTLTGRETRPNEFEYRDVDDLLQNAPPTTVFEIGITEDVDYGKDSPVAFKSLYVDLNGRLLDGRTLRCRLAISQDVPYSSHYNAPEALRRPYALADRQAKEILSRLASYVRMGGWVARVLDGRWVGGGENRLIGGWIAGGVAAPPASRVR